MITIIGAGPAGSHLAYLLAKEGKKVTIVEEHSEVGKPVQCTGLLTSDINKMTRIPDNVIVNRIKKIEVFAPNNNSFQLKLKSPELVVDRALLDKFLFEKAERAGAKGLLNHRFVDYSNNHITIKNNNKIKKIKTDILVGADGPVSRVAKIAGIYGKRKFYTGMQAIVKGNFRKDTYQVFLGKSFPGFFGWIVPESKSIARTGLATAGNPKKYFNNFLKSAGYEEIIERHSGLIPVYSAKQKIHGNNIFLLGDAALQVKATTGGGIIPGIKAAVVLKDVLINNGNYELRTVGIKKDLLLHLMMRRTLNNLTDKDYNILVEYCKDKSVREALENTTRENPVALMVKLLARQPRFLRYAAKTIA
ncbi:NAD(P)/FAD-dependent oxidoreductase [Candidatus Woesearchaeota archaeon]|nr:NAD(P)/FAD-dependent oxidoreductase [Candidatus Woesearchaeota archaeon]